ncbi:MAG: LLM class flavin-dependent oxidoreductase [Nitrososphaerota archaeon]
MLQLGIGLRGQSKLKEIIEYSRLAEQLSLHFIWVPDVDLERETFVTAACIALSTEKIGIGVISNPYTRHPAISAAAVATLNEIAEGRVRYALCAGGFKSLKPFGFASWEKPLSSIRKAVELSKSLFRGESVLPKGAEEGATLKLAFQSRHRIPIYIAAMTGKKMMELAGRVADGVLLAGPLGFEFTKSCIDHVIEGAIKAGRSAKEITIAMEALFSVSYDSCKAKEEAKSLVGEMIIADPRFTAALKAADIAEYEVELVKRSLSKSKEEIVKAVNERMVDQFSISGSPNQCVEKIRTYAEIGIQEICLLPPTDSNIKQLLNIIGKDILPSLQ